jgi:hypothetical protein
MGSRLDLHEILVTALGSRYVYFQPPASVIMQYPCIVYSRDSASTKFADGTVYNHKQRYQVTVIDKDPDSLIPDRVMRLPLCSFGAHFTKDNLNHDTYKLYY